MKLHFLTAAVLCCSSLSLKASVTIGLDAGVLRINQTGASTPGLEPIGGLLQIIATRAGANGTFSAPTPGAFTNGDNLVVLNFGMNNNNGTGEFGGNLIFSLENTSSSAAASFDQGDALLIRWWPTITFNSVTGQPSRLPTANDFYGQYRSNTGEGTTSPTNAMGIAWFAPADGSTFFTPNGLNFLTSETTDANNVAGTNPINSGFANFTVVPEPSTYALLGLGFGGLTFAMQQRRRQAAH